MKFYIIFIIVGLTYSCSTNNITFFNEYHEKLHITTSQKEKDSPLHESKHIKE